MCRFLGYLGPPADLHSLLFAPEHSLVRQSYAPRHQRHGRVNADGFGVGWYDRSIRPEPARYRRDRPIWSDRSLASLAPLVSSGAVVAAVRDATPPSPAEESGAPPFTAGRWLFAHNGAVTRFADGTGARLRAEVSPRRLAGVEGCADSEVVFALVLDALDRGASLGGALSGAATTVLAVTPARLNLLLTDGTALAATALGETLFVLDRAGMAGHGVVVASEPSDDHPGWQQVPDASVVVVTTTGVTVADLTAFPTTLP